MFNKSQSSISQMRKLKPKETKKLPIPQSKLVTAKMRATILISIPIPHGHYSMLVASV